MALVYLFWMVLASCCAFVTLLGDHDERVCVLAFAAASLLTALAISPMAVRYQTLEWRVLLIDLSLLGLFVRFVVTSRRYWPLWITGFQVVDVMGHTAVLSSSSPRAYAMTLGIIGYLILLMLTIGSWRSHARRSKANV